MAWFYFLYSFLLIHFFYLLFYQAFYPSELDVGDKTCGVNGVVQKADGAGGVDGKCGWAGWLGVTNFNSTINAGQVNSNKHKHLRNIFLLK